MVNGLVKASYHWRAPPCTCVDEPTPVDKVEEHCKIAMMCFRHATLTN